MIERRNNKKQVFKYTALNKPEPTLDHHKSMHTMNLQRSKYMCIDNATDKIFVFQNYDKKAAKYDSNNDSKQISKALGRIEDPGTKFLKMSRDVHFRYCPSTEITQKRQQLL